MTYVGVGTYIHIPVEGSLLTIQTQVKEMVNKRTKGPCGEIQGHKYNYLQEISGT